MQSPFEENLKNIADSMGIALYQRFSLNEASLFLRCSVGDVEKLKKQGKLEFINLPKGQLEFFGYQLLQYLLSTVSGDILPIAEQSTPDRVLRSDEVIQLTGLSRTTIWRLERKGAFPNRIALSAGSVGWRWSEVDAWLKSR